MKTLTIMAAITLFSNLSYGGEPGKLNCSVDKFNQSYDLEIASKSSKTIFQRNLELGSTLIINLQTKAVEMVANLSDDDIEDDSQIDSFSFGDNKGKYLIVNVSNWKDKVVLTNLDFARYDASIGDNYTTLAFFQDGIAVTCQK